jgi:molecular chaperone DnaK (HSP70)
MPGLDKARGAFTLLLLTDHTNISNYSNLGSSSLASFRVVGVSAALSKYASESNVASKGIRALFQLDDSGLLNVTAVEAVFERTISVKEQEEVQKEDKKVDKEAVPEEKKDTAEAAAAEEGANSAWGKLGDTISDLFGGGKNQYVNEGGVRNAQI